MVHNIVRANRDNIGPMFPKLLFIPRKHSQIISPLSVDVHQQSRSFAPSESTAETQPKLQPAFLTLSAMISQFFKRLQRVEPFRESAARMRKDCNRSDHKDRGEDDTAVAINSYRPLLLLGV